MLFTTNSLSLVLFYILGDVILQSLFLRCSEEKAFSFLVILLIDELVISIVLRLM